MTERPREVYLTACSQIAQGFEPLGFRYFRSKQKLLRREGDFVCDIQFQSSPRNFLIPAEQRDSVAEQMLDYGEQHNLRFTSHEIDDLRQRSIHLQMAATVRCKRLQEWRAAQTCPLRKDDHVADRRFGSFNLAPLMTREQSIVEAGVLARQTALPFFDLFKNPADLVGRVMEKEVPGFWEVPAFDFVLCFGGRELASEMLQRVLESDSSLKSRFVELLPRYQTTAWRDLVSRLSETKMPAGGHLERAGRLAQIAVAYDLG